MNPKFYRVVIERKSTGSVMRSVIAADGPSRVLIKRSVRIFFSGFRLLRIDDLYEAEFLREREILGEFLDYDWFEDG